VVAKSAGGDDDGNLGRAGDEKEGAGSAANSAKADGSSEPLARRVVIVLSDLKRKECPM
jgi:hypothetical protein